MLQKKSFNLINEDEMKKTEKRDFGWLRFLVVPALICFALILILVNVDFSGNADSIDLSTTTPDEDLRSTVITEQTLEASPALNLEPAALDVVCQETSFDKCSITCITLNFKSEQLNEELERQYEVCKNPMDLVLTAKFVKDAFTKSDLNGEFILANLTLLNCQLLQIVDEAFDKNSTNELENLAIIDSELQTITEKTFVGLKKIKFFKMINNASNRALEGKAFVKPMAATLQELTFQQRSDKLKKIMDPGEWLQGADLNELLRVELRGNHFPNTIKRPSFMTLKRVQVLSLQSCDIETLANDAFDPIEVTLQFLDLSRNNLKTLNSNFLYSIQRTSIELSLEDNKWACDCENLPMITSISDLKFKTEPVCWDPVHLRGTELKKVALCCSLFEDDDCSDEIPTTSNIKTTPTTIATTESSAEIYSTIALKCKRLDDPLLYDVYVQHVGFKIETTTSTSVTLTFIAVPGGGRLLYYQVIEKKPDYTVQELKTTMIIVDLIADQSYVFCLLPLYIEQLSPFDCRAHHMGESEFIAPWIKSSDMALFVTLTTLGAIILFLLGGIVVFLLLRRRPMLLGKNKRIVHLCSVSKKIFLKKRHSKLTAEEIYEAYRTYAAGSQADSNHYIKYYSSSELPTVKIQAISPAENLPPHARAPALPPLQALRTVSSASTMLADEVKRLDVILEHFNEHEYQSLDEYQQVYEMICDTKEK